MTPDKAFTLLLFSILLLLTSAAGGGGSPEDLIFRGFGGGASANLTLTGASTILPDGALRLTNDTQRVQGHAFYSRPFRLKDSTAGKALSFSAAFAFAIVPEYPKLGGHGLAFVLSPTSSISNSLPSQYLGLFNSTTATVSGGGENSSFSSDLPRRRSHLVAVEFDTVQDFEFSDIDDNHVGLDLDGLNSTAAISASAANVTLKSGRAIQAWINYDSVKSQLTVKLSHLSTEPPTPVLTADVDLSPYVGDSTFVGFSASTGLLASSHYVLGWEFRVNAKVNSLELSSLPSVPKPNKKNRQSTVSFALVASMSSFIALTLISAVAFYVVKKIKEADVIEPWELDIGPHRFTYDELKKATKGFREKELIGFGGFGKVYRGALRDKNNESVTRVAVKRISHESKQGLREFVSEISSVGRLRHRNLVQLLGWCRRRGDLLLVYDYMENGSLDKHLYGSDEKSTARVLTWGERFEIVKGVARGLLYLHEEWEQAVIHRDVKAGNVLLDSEMNARLGDFGLAKLYERGTNPSTTRVVGTLGYLAPELTRTGKPTTGSDIFAFGGLLLEVVCGRRPIEPKASPEELILVDWVWDRWRVGAILDVVDPRLNGEFEEGQVALVVKLGLMCSSDGPEARPSMKQVVRYLDGEVALPDGVAPPVGGYNGKKGGFEDYLHSYPSSSVYERASTMSSRFDDVETGSTTPLTMLR